MDEALAETVSQRFLHQDWRGSTVATSNVLGAVVDRYRYDPYGVPDAAGGLPIRFTGQYWDAEVGLYHYKARMYAPRLGRFLQTDPIEYADDQNWYTYVENDTVNFEDPASQGKLGFLIKVDFVDKGYPEFD